MRKKILSSILSLVFVFSIVTSAVMIFPQNAKSEEPPDSTNWTCEDLDIAFHYCNDGTLVFRCFWSDPGSCCPSLQDLCEED